MESTGTRRGAPSAHSASSDSAGSAVHARGSTISSAASAMRPGLASALASSTRSSCSNVDLFHGRCMAASCRCVWRLGSPRYVVGLPRIASVEIRRLPCPSAGVRRAVTLCFNSGKSRRMARCKAGGRPSCPKDVRFFLHPSYQRMTLATTETHRQQISVLFPYCQRQRTSRHREVLDLLTVFGRRDWTRTNDPHHVKVVL